MRNAISVDRLRELLHYEPETGIFTWRVDRYRKKTAGQVAGNFRCDGYIGICIEGVIYLAHRLAWLYVKGFWPVDQIDHKDRDRINNRFDNLRESSNKQNNENRILQANTASGIMGVSWMPKSKKWQVGIKHNGVRKHLGCFDSLLDAAAVRIRAEREVFSTSRWCL